MRHAVILAAAMLTAPAFAEPPVAKVAGHAIVHPGEGVAVRVPRAATYVGSDRFTLYGVADCEIHVFVEADARHRLRRLYWIQFESYLPSLPDKSYDYAKGNTGMMIGGIKTWVRAGPISTTGPTREGSDREHVAAMLKAAGYTAPDEMMNVRMVLMLDDPAGTGKGRRELMVIYSEEIASTGKTLADLTTDGAPDARWTPFEGPLIERAKAAVTVSRR